MTKYLKITDISLCHRYNIDIPKKPISKAPIRYNIIDVGNVSRYFRYIDPPLCLSITKCAMK